MKTSELINELQKHIDEHGDLDAFVFDEDETNFYPFGRVRYVDKDDSFEGEYYNSFIGLYHKGYYGGW